MSISINGKLLKGFNFPGGECHICIDPDSISEVTTIHAFLTSSDDVMTLLLAFDAVRRVNANTCIDLHIPYFPYARQDRVCKPGEPFSLEVMAGLINSLGCRSVHICDPHSTTTVELLKNVHVLSLKDIIIKYKLPELIKRETFAIVSPDAGAKDKVSEVANYFGCLFLHASKIRSRETGNIIETRVLSEVPRDLDLIILDDICDGGRTFIELSKALKAQHSGRIYLYVTHGIFSKGLSVLKPYFSHVYCYNTMLKKDQIDQEFLTVLKNREDEL